MKRFYSENIGFCFSVLAVLVMLPFIAWIPFFWDMTYISEVANHIFDSNFSSLIKPNIDNGTPPLFSLMLALIWKVFGKSLFISHLFNSLIFIGFLWQINLLSKHFLGGKARNLLFLLIFADSVLLSQSIFIGYDIAITFFTFFALNAILNQKRWLLVLAIIPIPLLNIRGISIVVFIYLFEIISGYFSEKPKAKTPVFINYLPVFFAAFLWFFYHGTKSDFYVVSQQNELLHQFSTVAWFVLNSGLALWKLLDFNRVFVFIFLGFLLFKYLKLQEKSYKLQEDVRFFLLSIITFFAVFIFFFASYHYPVGHRYFIVPSLLSLIFLLYLVQEILPKKLIFITLLFSFLLFSGNFYFYNQKFGNGWDTSLKGISYIKIKEKALNYLKDSGEKNKKIASIFPEIRNQKYAYLKEEKNIEFVDFQMDSIQTYDYIFYSNTFNILPLSLPTLKVAGFEKFKEYHSGFATIEIFKNTKRTIE